LPRARARRSTYDNGDDSRQRQTNDGATSDAADDLGEVAVTIITICGYRHSDFLLTAQVLAPVKHAATRAAAIDTARYLRSLATEKRQDARNAITDAHTSDSGIKVVPTYRSATVVVRTGEEF
jgi:hypothetical protein